MLILPAFLLAIYYPEVGNLAGILGAAATMLVIYIVPNMTYLKMKWDATYSKKNVDAFEYETMRQENDKELIKQQTGTDSRNSNLSRNTNVNEHDETLDNDMDEFNKRIPPTSKLMLGLLIIFCLIVTTYGILAFIFQLQG